LEELLSALRDTGALEVREGVVHMDRARGTSELPGSLRGLVAARVGKLAAPHRVILQLAVTFGPRFVPELLARAAGQDEASVRQGLGVLEESGTVRALGPSEFAFAHELVREILYDSIPVDERPSLHAAVAQALESLGSADVEAASERLAYHHSAAGNREKAIDFMVRAARRFEQEPALDAAVHAYLQAITFMEQDSSPDATQLLALYVKVGELAYQSRSAEHAAERLGQAWELAERTGSDDYLARLSMLRGRLFHKASRLEEGRAWLERAQAAAQRRGDHALERDVALAAAEAHARNGEYNNVLHHVGEALELARKTGDARAHLRCLLLIAPAYAATSHEAEAREALREIEERTRDKDRMLELERERVRALVLHYLGDREGSLSAARHGFELAKEYGLLHEAALAAHMLGEVYLRAEEEKRAFAALRSSYDLAVENGFTRIRWLNVCLLGFLDVLRFAGDRSGLERMREALRYASDHGYVWDSINGQYLLAMAEQQLGTPQAARLALGQVRDLAQRHGHLRIHDDAISALKALDHGQPIALPR
jgi:tetratricopeptide (TPR) repeat protein